MDAGEIFRGLWKLRDRDLAILASLLVSHGIDIENSPEDAYEWCARHADAGEPEAQHALAKLLWIGLGCVRNDHEAARWCERASNQGYLPAMVMLSGFYSTGIGVKADNHTAIQLLKTAVNGGSPDAMCVLATTYEHGIGVEPNHSKALVLWESAAVLGHAEAQFFFGKALIDTGVSGTIGTGVRWLNASAQQGFSSAHYLLAHLYRTGARGLKKDEEKATKHLKAAMDLEEKE